MTAAQSVCRDPFMWWCISRNFHTFCRECATTQSIAAWNILENFGTDELMLYISQRGLQLVLSDCQPKAKIVDLWRKQSRLSETLLRCVSEQDKEPLAEPVIVKSVLGHRSGYIKRMRHGVQVLRSHESNVFAGIDLKEKFLELDSAKAEIVHLTKAHTEQGKKIDKMESQMATMLLILQHIPGIPSDFCRSS